MEFDCRVLQWCPGRVGCQRKAQQHRGPSRSLQARHLCWYSAFKHLPCLTNLTICALFCKYKTTSLLQCLPEEGHKVWSFSFTSWWSSLLSPCKLVSFRCVIDLCLTWALFCCYREQSLTLVVSLLVILNPTKVSLSCHAAGFLFPEETSRQADVISPEIFTLMKAVYHLFHLL